MSYNFNQSAAHSRCERVISQDRPKIPTYGYRGQSERARSAPNASIGVATVKETVFYTGDAIVGIATMHKSNSIPVFSQKDAEDVAKMRR